MSSSLGAGQWIADSKDGESILEPIVVDKTNTVVVPRKINNKTYQLVADMRQRLLDGYYDDESKVYVDTVHIREHTEVKHGKIVGITLGNGGEKQIAIHDQGIAKNRELIEKHFYGVPGQIHFLLQKINGEVESVYIGRIADIKSSATPKAPKPTLSLVEDLVVYDFTQHDPSRGAEQPEWIHAFSI